MTRILSFVVLVAAVVALISFFMAVGSVILDPFRAAFDPFNFTYFGAAIFGFMEAISLPLILGMLALIGLSMSRRDR